MDKFSKFMFAVPLRKATSQSIIKFMKTELLVIFGMPEIVYTDNGSQFKCKMFTIKFRRKNQPKESIIAAIRSYLKSDQRDWDKHIHEIMASLRSSLHQAIQTSPFQAVFGYDMIFHGSPYELLTPVIYLKYTTKT